MKPNCWLSVFSICIALSAGAATAASPGQASDETRLRLASGSVNVALNVQAMKDVGVSLGSAGQDLHIANLMFQIDGASSSFQLSRRNGKNEGLFGMLQTNGGATWEINSGGPSEKSNVGDFLIGFGGRHATISDARDIHVGLFEIAPETIKIDYDAEFSHLLIRGEITLSEQFMLSVFATDRGIGNTVGNITIEGVAEAAESVSGSEYGSELAAGPDVTVGELRGDTDGPTSQPRSWGIGGAYAGYSVGTTSCNVGTQPLDWYDFGTATPDKHPVINQGIYRYKTVNGSTRFEMLGQSWLKHGFCALQGTVCGACTPFCGGCCDELGVGCSDPYTAQRNGTRSGMGPKSQINAAQGKILVWPYPSAPSDDNSTGRIRCLTSELDPAQNSGALYYAEGQYVAEDDAAAGNKNNNASYRRCLFGASPSFTMTWANTANGQTLRQNQAIKAWKVNDSQVAYTDVDVANDGRFTLGYRVTDLSGVGNGPWHYEYAVHNMNSDRSGKSFAVPCPSGVSITNTEFRDVGYYKDGFNNGTAYDGTDWPVTTGGGSVSWNMVTASPADNSNALRWGTMYNFRFDATSPPVAGTIGMDLFKAGAPQGIQFASLVPSPVPCTCPGDVNSNSRVDGDDIIPFTAMYLAQMPVSDCADVAAPSGGPLDDADVNGFVDLLVNGTNACK